MSIACISLKVRAHTLQLYRTPGNIIVLYFLKFQNLTSSVQGYDFAVVLIMQEIGAGGIG